MTLLKKLISCCFLVVFYCTVSWAQCPDGSLSLYSQADVDNFPMTYPNCTEISGSLLMTGVDSMSSDITDLSSLSQITYVGSLQIINNDSLTSLSGLSNLTSIHNGLGIIDNENLISLNGLSSLASITFGSINIIDNNNLTSISDLSNLIEFEFGSIIKIESNSSLMSLNGLEGVTSLLSSLEIIDNDKLINLNGLENLVETGNLYIAYNENLLDLSGLDNLTSVQDDLSIWYNDSLTTINALSNLMSVEGSLSISFNYALLNLDGLENITSVGGLGLTLLDLRSLTNIDGIKNITSVAGNFGIIGIPNLPDLSALENLISIGGNLQITGTYYMTNLIGLENLEEIGDLLQIAFNRSLTNLNGLQNLDYDGIARLEIYKNSLLNICEIPPVCAYLANGNTAEIYNNASGCNDAVEVAAACTLGIIQTDVFYDLNQNQIQDTDEINYYDVAISINDDVFYSQNDGLIFIEPDSYTVAFDEANNPNWQLTTSPTSYALNVETGEIETTTFGIYPAQQISDIQTTINATSARCNDTITFNVNTRNIGTTIASGIMWLTTDNESPVADFIHQPDTIIANTYGWYFSDLFPSQSIKKQLEIQIPGPPDFMPGDLLVFDAYVDFEDMNGSQSIQPFIYETEIRCSYDPNDKLVHPNREGDYVLFEESFIYTIRFQNTGNDVAYDVVIRDTLDANLDVSTFRVLGSSHNSRLNTILRDEGILTFEFKNIFLPDSTSNFEASQGYITYLIKTIDGLAEDTPVTNSAGIYFDMNPPVITNTVQSVMVSELPTVSTEMPNDSFNFSVLPNPSAGVFTVQGVAKGIYQILNTSGQIIRQGDMQNDLLIDISPEAQGVYFISVTVDDATSVRRIVKM